jgi:hypothetical protein
MATDTLVEDKIDGGQKLVIQLIYNNFDVTAACWVKTGEEGRWFLYSASKYVDKSSLAAAYRVAYGVPRSMEAPWVSMSEIKL